ncbi:hypothetical protein [Paraburkholderia tropica]|uniref:hypothetical protein n=1 Tax=Paraburkholderia tropica TaxID=92647 RepID=UPI002AB0C278|nr:hypothetical protein [Paraburkholderia tropica]
MTAEIKNAPARIYLNLGPVPSEEIEFSALHEVTWCADKQDASDIEYVLAHSDAVQAPNDEIRRYAARWEWARSNLLSASIQSGPHKQNVTSINPVGDATVDAFWDTLADAAIGAAAPVAPAAAVESAFFSLTHGA